MCKKHTDYKHHYLYCSNTKFLELKLTWSHLGVKWKKDSKGWLLGVERGEGLGLGVYVAMVTGAKNEKKQKLFWNYI